MRRTRALVLVVAGAIALSGARAVAGPQTLASQDGFIDIDATPLNACGGGPDPCGNGGTCTINGAGWTCICPSGYVSSGGTMPTCINYNACTGAANIACVTSQSGNACVDDAPPSVGYHCSCGNAAYTGSGTTSCTDKNDCVGNPCIANGDIAATCTDHVAPLTGHDCTCTTGFVSNGVTCVSACGVGTDPCGNGGTCTVSGVGWTCMCPTGYASSGGTNPACVNYNACTGAANLACVASQSGNACVDEAPPSITYHCACGNVAYTGTGTTSCTDDNECAPNQCVANGDNGATCTDHVAPSTGYDCTCTAGFMVTSGSTPTCVASPADAGADANGADASSDAATIDASANDGGAGDAGSSDAGSGDAGSSDAGSTDGSSSDGGAVDGSAADSSVADSGSNVDAGGDASDAPAGDDGACGCRTSGARTSSFAWLVSIAAFAIALTRRRRRVRPE